MFDARFELIESDTTSSNRVFQRTCHVRPTRLDALGPTVWMLNIFQQVSNAKI